MKTIWTINLTYFSMQSKTDVCIYYSLEAALLLHNDITVIM